jgi:hypothetical protein
MIQQLNTTKLEFRLIFLLTKKSYVFMHSHAVHVQILHAQAVQVHAAHAHAMPAHAVHGHAAHALVVYAHAVQNMSGIRNSDVDIHTVGRSIKMFSGHLAENVCLLIQ